MSKTLIRMTEATHRTGHCRSWLYKLVAENRFPQPVKIGSRSIAFVESEVDQWIEQRIAESRGEAA